ncbi:hypothetical protein ACSBR2_042855 [Camellia fascicularis]
MSDVVPMLTNENIILPAPKQPAYFIEQNRQEAPMPAKLDYCSINEVSISVMVPR